MIEVELPDGSVAEFPDGTGNDVIQSALRKRFPTPTGETEDALRSFANGVARGTPKMLDFASSGVASLVDNSIGNGGDYFDENLSPRTPVFNRAADAVFGEEYKPQTFTGKAAQFGGELVSPGGVAKGIKNAAGFVKGLTTETAPFVRDSSALLQRFKDWKTGIEATPINGSQISQDIVEPFNKATKFTQPYADPQSLAKVQQLNDLGKAGKTNLGYVYGLRKTLSNVDASIAQPMREAIDSGLNKYASREGLDAYRQYKVAENVDDALRNYGNETIKATRTKLNNLDKTGMTAVEKSALREAGRGGVGEGLLRLGGRGANALTSAMTGIASGNAGLGVGMYGAGRGLEKLADLVAARRIEALRGTILNGREAPSVGERFGALARGKIKQNVPESVRLLNDQAGSVSISPALSRYEQLGDVSVGIPDWYMTSADKLRFQNPLNLRDGSRISGFTDASGKVFFGYDKNGDVFTKRVGMLLPDELVENSKNAKFTSYMRDRINGLVKPK